MSAHSELPELAACPFCGGKARLAIDHSASHALLEPPDAAPLPWWTICDECGAAPRASHASKIAAIAAWNRRAPVPAHAALVEALEECREHFADRADAEYFTDKSAPAPNAEMRLLAVVTAALGREERA